MERSRKNTCVFCLKSNDEKTCGKIYVKSGVAAHYFCMLFASGLCQNGKSEKDGILGFLPHDILKEAKRGTRLRCIYCKKPGATIGCVIRNCRASFHLPCGRNQGSMHQFFGTFCSYCPAHYVEQDVPSSDDTNVVCSICIDTVKPAPVFESLRAPCCSKNWYHRECIQNSASSAGIHFFKCPLCNNKDEFQNEMLKMGIYIPDQDASWEKEPNAFQELLQRYNQCDATDCKCEQGRQYSKDEGRWKIILCDFCGSQGSHKCCKHLVKLGKDRVCPDCKEIHHKGTECFSSDSDFSPCKKSSLDQCSSPEPSKASSSYPGPSYSLKKKGLPKLTDEKNHKKSKKRKLQDNDNNNASKKPKNKKSATVCFAESSSPDSSASSSSCPPLSTQGPKKRGRKKKSEKKPWLHGSQSILRAWLKSKKTLSPKKSSTSEQELVYRSSPRKNKPIVMKWEGKEVLIKSPRIVLHRNRIYSKQVTNPCNLEIDMNDGKIGSSWKKEMELLTNIDSDKRVTRNMIDIDTSKNTSKHDNAKEKIDNEEKKTKQVTGSGSKVKINSSKKSLVGQTKGEVTNKIVNSEQANKSILPNQNGNSVKSSTKNLSGQKDKKVKLSSSQRKIDFPILSPLKDRVTESLSDKKETSPKVKNAKEQKCVAVSTSVFDENDKLNVKSLSLDSISNYSLKSDTDCRNNTSEKKLSSSTKSSLIADMGCLDTLEGPIDHSKKPVDHSNKQVTDLCISPSKDQDSLSKTRKSMVASTGKNTPRTDSSIKNCSMSSDLLDSPAKNLRRRKLHYEPEKSNKVNPSADSVVSDANILSDAANSGNKSLQKSGQPRPTSEVNDGEKSAQVTMATEPDFTDLLPPDIDPDDVIPLILTHDESLESQKTMQHDEEKEELYWHFEGTRQVSVDSPSHFSNKTNLFTTVCQPSNEKVTLIESTSPVKESNSDKTINFSIAKILNAKKSTTTTLKKTPTTRQRTSRWDIGPGGKRMRNNQNVCPSKVDNAADEAVVSNFEKSLSPSSFSHLRDALSKTPSFESSSPVAHKSTKIVDDSPPCKNSSFTQQNILKSLNKHTNSGTKQRSHSRLCYKRHSDVTNGTISDKDIMAEYYKSAMPTNKGGNSIDRDDEIMKFLPLNH